MYEYEKNMKRTLYSSQEQFKYRLYVNHAMEKGSLSTDEGLKRIRTFNAYQDRAKEIRNMAKQ